LPVKEYFRMTYPTQNGVDLKLTINGKPITIPTRSNDKVIEISVTPRNFDEVMRNGRISDSF